LSDATQIADRGIFAVPTKAVAKKTREQRGVSAKAVKSRTFVLYPDKGWVRATSFGRVYEVHGDSTVLMGDEPYRRAEQITGTYFRRPSAFHPGEFTQSFEVPFDFRYEGLKDPSSWAEIRSGSVLGERTTETITSPDELAKLRAENEQLSLKLELLKAELHKNIPSLQLYRFGAGAFSLSVISLLTWLFTGVAIPFHPIFATVIFPVGPIFMAMAWFTRKESHQFRTPA
jgi:hypothetical protein